MIHLAGDRALEPIDSPDPIEIRVSEGVELLRLRGTRAASLRVTAPGAGTTVRLEGPIATDGDLILDVAGDVELDTTPDHDTAAAVLDAGRHLHLRAGGTLRLHDAAGHPLAIRSRGQLKLEGAKLLDVAALGDSRSAIAAGGDLILRSTAPVQGDAHWIAGHDFRVEDLSGRPGDLVSPADPVVLSSRNVSLGSYTGASLHVLAGGSVTLSAVTITGPDLVGNSIAAGNNATFNGTSTFADLRAVTLSNGTPLLVDGAARATLDVRAGIDWTTFAGGAPSPDDQVLPLASVAPTFSAPVSTASITTGNISVGQAAGMVLITNQYRPTAALAGDVTTGAISTSTTSPGLSGGFILLDSRGNLATGVLSSYSSTGAAAAGTGGAVIALAADDLTVSTVASYSESLAASGASGGPVMLRAGGRILGTPYIRSSADSATGSGNGGDIAIEATGPLAIDAVDSHARHVGVGFSGNGGDVTILARGEGGQDGAQTLLVDYAITDSGSQYAAGATGASSDGGDIELTTEDGDVTVTNWLWSHTLARGGSATTGRGGDVLVTAENGDITIGPFGINTSSETTSGSTGNSGRAGNVSLVGSGAVVVNNAVGNGGIRAVAGSTGGAAGHGGSVLVDAGADIDLGTNSISTSTAGAAGASAAGGAVSLAAAGSIKLSSVITTSSGGAAGSAGAGGGVTVDAGGDFTIGNDVATWSTSSAAAAGGGGDVSITTGGRVIGTPAISASTTAATLAADGGDVSIAATGPLVLDQVDTFSRFQLAGASGDAGDVSILVHGAGPQDGGQPLTVNLVWADSGARYHPGATGSAGDGGDIHLATEDGDVTFTNWLWGPTLARGSGFASGRGGDVTVSATNGAITVGDFGLNTSAQTTGASSGSTGRAGHVSLVADGAVTIDDGTNTGIQAWARSDGGAAGQGGNVHLAGTGIALGTNSIVTDSLGEGAAEGGGNVALTATGPIGLQAAVTSAISQTSTAGAAGRVELRGAGDIVASHIRGRSSGPAGAAGGAVVIVDTPGTLRLFGGSAGTPTVDVTGLPGTGKVVLSHGGGAVTPFTVGDATFNGTAFAVVTADASLAPTVPYPASHFEAPSIWILGDEPALLVNEIDAEQPGDPAEFVELYNPFLEPMPLGLVRLDVVDGTGDSPLVVHQVALPDVVIPAGGRTTICPTGSAAVLCDLFHPFELPDVGPAAVALRLGGILEDTVSYEGYTAGGYTEGPGDGPEDPDDLTLRSLARLPDGADTNDNASDFSVRCATPGGSNLAATTGCTSPAIFVDGFELGDPSAWSDVVP